MAQAKALAVAIRNSENLARGLGELAHARAALPQRVKAGLDRASSAARQSAAGIKAHYDFLSAAHDFQAKYEDMLRKRPELTERGRQFIARLELAETSERLKLTSVTAADAAKRTAVRSLAHIIAGLQTLQRALESRAAQGGSAPGGRNRGSAPLQDALPPIRNTARRPPVILDEEPVMQPEEPEERPGALPSETSAQTLRPAFLLDGMKLAAFDGVVAWYKPAVAAVAARKIVQDDPPDAPIGSAVLAHPRAAGSTADPGAGRQPRRSVWSWLAGHRPARIEDPVAHPSSASAGPRVSPLPAAPSPGRGNPGKASLAAKLTALAPVDLAGEEPDNGDDAKLAQAEDDDSGELTRSILESRAQAPEQLGRASSSRAFPWLRR